MYCNKCGNSNPKLFGFKNGIYYCRACLEYNGTKARINKSIKPKTVRSKISYNLSKKQKEISKIVSKNSEEIYIDAVCGSGKTEIVFESIEKAIAEGKRVGFAIPRKDIVIEIYERLKQVYPKLNIVYVCGGHHEYLDGDIVVLTCHQCYRYKNKFGLLIIDEYDAFPLKNNIPLMNITKSTSNSKIIYLSATFSKSFLENKNAVSLSRRFHNFDIPVPKIIQNNIVILFIKLLKIIKNDKDILFVFVPTINISKILTFLLRIFTKKCLINYHSKVHNRDKIFKRIKQKKYELVICTNILERGITLRGLNVVVFKANHSVFDVSTLIQICGRVGRKLGNEKGDITFLVTKNTSQIEQTISSIVEKNNEIR